MKKLIPLFVLFSLVTGLLATYKSALQKMGLHVNFVLGVNIILFVLATAALLLVSRRAAAESTHVFMRGVYSSFLLKMFVIVAALFIFITLFKEVNKPAIFVSMGLYILYTGVEVFQLMKLVRNQKNE